jgi:hypothetical protein
MEPWMESKTSTGNRKGRLAENSPLFSEQIRRNGVEIKQLLVKPKPTT